MNDYTMSLIQTTAALNSGNSGGPSHQHLWPGHRGQQHENHEQPDHRGGPGFAIPSTTAQRVVNALITEGTVDHPVLGITCYAVTAGDQEGNQVSGIYVVTVNEVSDAAAQASAPGTSSPPSTAAPSIRSAMWI